MRSETSLRWDLCRLGSPNRWLECHQRSEDAKQKTGREAALPELGFF